VHNYHDVNNVIPADGVFLGPAWASTNGVGPGWTWCASWALTLLPNLEQQAIFNAHNFNQNPNEAYNNTSGFQQIATYLCPSDNIKQRPAPPWGALSYHGNHGGPGVLSNWSGTIVQNYTRYPAEWWGADSQMAYFGFEGISDGTSNTALFSERLLGLAGDPGVAPGSPNAKRGIWDAGYQGLSNQPGIQTATILSYVNLCKSSIGTRLSDRSSLSGAHYSLSFPWHTSNTAYTHFNSPNALSCTSNNGDRGGGTWGGESGMINATSNHPGGVNVCFTDGSVKFIKDTINAPTWWALGTKSGGETVSSDSY